MRVVLAVMAVLLAACGGAAPSGSPTASPADSTPSSGPSAAATASAVPSEVVADVNAVFAEYRSGVVQRDAGAVIAAVTPASLDRYGDLAEAARTATRDEVVERPAVDQLLILTWRWQPQLLAADDPFAALVEAGLAGQDRALGDLGALTLLDDDTALGVVVDPATGAETPLRWRFARVDGTWRHDLAEADALTSSVISTTAARQGVAVDELVLGEFRRLSGLDADAAAALYEPSES